MAKKPLPPIKSIDLVGLKAGDFAKMSQAQFQQTLEKILEVQAMDRKESQIYYYQPASEESRQVHESSAYIVGVGGGNRSSKTETVLAQLVALATGCIPESVFDDIYPKFRGPINVRVCIESLTTVLHPIMLPKLQWYKWTGIDQQGGEKGHWGRVPRDCLKSGAWEKSWSEKLRTLTVLCRDPLKRDKVIGESIIQFMSYDQDWSDFASGTFHHVMHDEPPPYMIWKENRARTLDVNGTTYLVMTWPDDPAINVDWVFDEVYEKGLPGPQKDPAVDWIVLNTLKNKTLDAAGIMTNTKGWSAETKSVKLDGMPIRFSNRVHPLFTDLQTWWSVPAQKVIHPINGRCPETMSEDIVEFNHVRDFEISSAWPTVFLLDPHPRKPHMGLFVQIDPSDDYWVCGEIIIAGECEQVQEAKENFEERYNLYTALSLIDPNMGRSPSSARDRDVCWQDEFTDVGLRTELADDSSVGRGRLNEYLKPDRYTLQPRIHIHPRCQQTIWQTKRYIWDDYKVGTDKDQKQKPKDKYDDFPTLLKYLMNYQPTFSRLKRGAEVWTRPGTRKGAY